jgi:hypothetical protein
METSPADREPRQRPLVRTYSYRTWRALALGALAIVVAATGEGASALFRAGHAAGYSRARADAARRDRLRAAGAPLCVSRAAFRAGVPPCAPASPLGSADGPTSGPAAPARERGPALRT